MVSQEASGSTDPGPIIDRMIGRMQALELAVAELKALQRVMNLREQQKSFELRIGAARIMIVITSLILSAILLLLSELAGWLSHDVGIRLTSVGLVLLAVGVLASTALMHYRAKPTLQVLNSELAKAEAEHRAAIRARQSAI